MSFPLALDLMLISAFVGSSVGIRTQKDVPPRFLANGNCRILINEINIFPAGGGQYIELMRACTPAPTHVYKVTMEKYFKLGFFDHAGSLIGVCSLKGEAKQRTGNYIFYTIGGGLVENADMRITECQFAKDSGYPDNVFPSADKAPVAVGLFYHSKGLLSWLSLSEVGGVKAKTPITYSLEKMMVKHIVDLYVYTTSSPYTGCDYFARFYEGYKNGNEVILRDWAQLDVDRGLSRCNPEDVLPEIEFDPLNPTYFKYALRTPGDVNKCNNAKKFRIEETQLPRVPAVIHFAATPAYSCYITTTDPFMESNQITSAYQYHSILKDMFQDSSWVTTAAVIPMIETDTRLPECELSTVPQSEFESKLAEKVPHIWQDCEEFKPKELISSLRLQADPHIFTADILKPEVCSWMEYIQPNKFQCKLCRQLWSQKIIFDRPGSKYLKAIKQPKAFRTAASKDTKYKNRRIINEHLHNPLHEIALDYFRLFDSGLRGQALKEEFERVDGPLRTYLRETETEIKVVLQSIRMDIPFYKHELMIEFCKHFNIKVGHLYHTPTGAKTLTMSISNLLHEDLVSDWRSRKPELSVLIDTSTDVSSLASIAILFQTYDVNNEVVIKLYRLMKAQKRETGEILFQMFLDSLEKDGIAEWVKEKIVGFASDGGSNVKKFRRLLIQWTGRQDLQTVHCFAHKLDLVLQHSWGETPYLKDVDRVANSLYRMFNSRSHKKKEMLFECADRLQDKRFELKRIIPTRWVSSKRRALDTVVAHWKTLVEAVDAVIDDRTTTTTQRADATALHTQLRDATLMGTMAFITDTCSALSVLNLELQKQGTTLIGKKYKREKLVEHLTLLKLQNGDHLQWFLDHASVTEGGPRGAPAIEPFETQKIYVDGITMNNPSIDNPNNLHLEKDKYIDWVLDEIDYYFPEDVTDNLDIFDQQQWPPTGLDHYGNAKLLVANEELKWNFSPAQLVQDWTDVKTMVTQRIDYNRWSKKTPELFWQHYLYHCSDCDWPLSLKSIINRLLVIPATTVEVERVYSLYTNVKTVQRYRLDISTVEAILRIKFNGPKSLEDFDATRYARNFILEGHSRVDDSTRRGKKRANEDSEESEEEDESLAIEDNLPEEGGLFDFVDFWGEEVEAEEDGFEDEDGDV